MRLRKRSTQTNKTNRVVNLNYNLFKFNVFDKISCLFSTLCATEHAAIYRADFPLLYPLKSMPSSVGIGLLRMRHFSFKYSSNQTMKSATTLSVLSEPKANQESGTLWKLPFGMNIQNFTEEQCGEISAAKGHVRPNFARS